MKNMKEVKKNIVKKLPAVLAPVAAGINFMHFMVRKSKGE